MELCLFQKAVEKKAPQSKQNIRYCMELCLFREAVEKRPHKQNVSTHVSNFFFIYSHGNEGGRRGGGRVWGGGVEGEGETG